MTSWLTKKVRTSSLEPPLVRPSAGEWEFLRKKLRKIITSFCNLLVSIMTSLSVRNVSLLQWRQNSFILEMSIISRWTFYDWLFCSWLAALLLCSIKSSGIMNFSSGDQNKSGWFWRTDEDEWEDNSPGALTEDSGRGIVRITVMAFAHWRGFNFFDLVSSDADSGEVRQALNVSVTPTFIKVLIYYYVVLTMFLV